MLKTYRVQRPSVVWVETEVQANNLDEALDIAESNFKNGNLTELDDTWEIDWSRHWIETHDGLVFTESFAPAEPTKH
jgi:hypothetical protein